MEREIEAGPDFFETVSEIEIDGSLPRWNARSPDLDIRPPALTPKRNGGLNQQCTNAPRSKAGHHIEL